VCMACFPDQMRGDDAVNDAQHPAHDLRPHARVNNNRLNLNFQGGELKSW
jgi:hypothetical protein